LLGTTIGFSSCAVVGAWCEADGGACGSLLGRFGERFKRGALTPRGAVVSGAGIDVEEVGGSLDHGDFLGLSCAKSQGAFIFYPGILNGDRDLLILRNSQKSGTRDEYPLRSVDSRNGKQLFFVIYAFSSQLLLPKQCISHFGIQLISAESNRLIGSLGHGVAF
jgi:hypothetical protein